ncbi:hypothetical protein C2I18_13680 [Paenibacillus sp. PK3_47]|uniref:nucleotidyltransferase family protein n=1 Tax=Paenibacillus sp. PK3_47 TaxID=2072642 RepID=UPI00201D93F8|nr:nucleotidyltransferase family protein [Paenibacillus sp. PK3_47]UQZ34476.1 hypothetical protein C2I18_13680 [Paenibacillus sp. PK3_47]
MPKIHNEEDIIRVVKEDAWMMSILAVVKELALPDSWVCAGFVRSKVWDVQHGFTARTPLPDIDVIYYDPDDAREETEKIHEERLRRLYPSAPWSVKNQARMHKLNNLPPYSSAADGMSKFPETATALGLSLDSDGEVLLAAPHGVHDVIHLKLRPTPHFKANPQIRYIYEKRIAAKNWQAVWPGLTVTSFH